MSQRMLPGIRDRAEGTAAEPGGEPDSEPIVRGAADSPGDRSVEGLGFDRAPRASVAVPCPVREGGKTGGIELTTRQFTLEEARAIGERIGIDWGAGDVDLEQFRMGLAVELEHGSQDPVTNVTDDDEIITGKIALAHLKEISDYYTRLAAMEQDAER
jgi:hypothetical protein